ncbi:MAG: response regulator [Flavipsychrobacter sp.]|nr:response regulator [Flavipsychrobacter sp.]
MTMHLDFIIVDNNSLNCFIAERMLQNIDSSIGVHTFLHAQEAYEYIKKQPVNPEGHKTVVMLDIHMPLMDGFAFLQEFQKLPEEQQNSFAIYIITSSTDINDKLRSNKVPAVKRFMSKPITFNMLNEIISNMMVEA